MTDSTPPVTSRSTQPVGSKWTVSPEFGDALLAAMRERSHSGGPLPRLPSMLQLPSPEIPSTPSSTSLSLSPTKPESAERLKMKTRVAIRDRNPHRFQVVPLRDAVKYTGNHKPLNSQERARAPLELTPVKGLGIDRSNTRSWKRSRDKENDCSLVEEHSVKIDDLTSRFMILSERDRNRPNTHNLSASALHSSHDSLESPLDSPLQPKMTSTTATVLNSHKRYFKSSSLGNLRTKPKLDIDLKANPLPRVTTCWKRTNTLSADPRRSHDSDRSITKDYAQRDDPRLGKKDSVRRHAIYTQSLYVPFHERPNIPSLPDETPRTTQNAQLSEESPTLQDYPFRSSIQTRLNKYATLPAAPSKDSLTLLDSGIPTPRSRHFNTQTSMSSIYSQDTYHSRHSSRTGSLAKTTHNISHHPIILQLLIDVEQVRQEWSSM